MIKAVLFDLYHTLIHYSPPREVSLAASLKRNGIEREPTDLSRPMIAGDEYFYEQGSQKSLGQRSREEKLALWTEYQTIVLKEAGIEPQAGLIRAILTDMKNTKYEMVLFEDVLPAFEALHNQGKLLGLISNVDSDIQPMLEKLGIADWLTIRMTSAEAGVTKPRRGIFDRAVEKTGFLHREVLYVGDQYQIDVIGARNAGLAALLIDRKGIFTEVPSTEKIGQLTEVSAHLA